MIQELVKVLEKSESTGNTRLAAIALANYADQDGVSWPSMDTIANLMNASTRTAQRAVADLKTLREVAVFKRTGEWGQRSNLYVLLVGRSWEDRVIQFRKVCRERLALNLEETDRAWEEYAGGRIVQTTAALHPPYDDTKLEKDPPGGDNLTPPHDNVVTPPTTTLSPDPLSDPSLTHKKPGARVDHDLVDIVNALVEVTGMSGHLNWGTLSSFGRELLENGYVADSVMDGYGPNSWWKKIDWRGKKGQRPTVAIIRQTIRDAVEWDGIVPGTQDMVKETNTSPAFELEGFFDDFR